MYLILSSVMIYVPVVLILVPVNLYQVNNETMKKKTKLILLSWEYVSQCAHLHQFQCHCSDL